MTVSTPGNPDFVLLGVVVSAHGIKGAVKIKTFTETPEGIAAYPELHSPDGRAWKLKLSGAPKEGSVTATLSGIADRNAAEALKGLKLGIARAALPETEDDALYVEDLEGLICYLADGTRFGTIVSIQNFGASDLAEVRLDATGDTEFFTFTEDTFPELDLEGRRAVIHPPEEV